MIAGLTECGLTLTGAVPLAALFAAGNARAVADAAPPRWLIEHGRQLALASALAQLLLAIATSGPMAGSVLVLTAWRVGGSLFVPMANAWPALTLRSSAALAAAGALMALTGALG